MKYLTGNMFYDTSPSTRYVQEQIASTFGVESADIQTDGSIYAIISNGVDRDLREAILDIGRKAMIPVRVAYRMSDGKTLEENKNSPKAKQEWVSDYFTVVKIPGFAGEPREAPPEEIAADPKGALRLLRVRSKTRGRPVVAWRLGDQEMRTGTTVKFAKEACLQWTMGRTISIKPGATADVSDLSSRRPIAFAKIGEYDGVELPIHMLGHAFHVDLKKVEAIGEAKKSKLPFQMKKLMVMIGQGGQASDWDDTQGRRRNPDDDQARLGTAGPGSASMDDDLEFEVVSDKDLRED